MKKISLIFFAFNFQLLTLNCFAQWVLQQSGTTNALLDVEFINRNTGWACGDAGKIIKTTNGGINWILQNSGIIDKYLYGIHPVDSMVVYCVGWFQTILKSTDGGSNWTIIRNGLGDREQASSRYSLLIRIRDGC